MKKFNYKSKGILIVSCLMLLFGCGLNRDEKNEIEKDKHPASKLALAYVEEKYDKNTEVVDVFGTSETFALETSYDGNLMVELRDMKKKFYVWVNTNTKECRDNYQQDEIKQDIAEYVKKISQGKVLNIDFTTFEHNGIDVLNKKVDTIFKNEAFFHSNYTKDAMLEFISCAKLEISTVDANVEKINAVVENLDSSHQNLGELSIYDFKDIELYEDFVEGEIYIDRQATLFDESLYHFFSEQENTMNSHAYIKYQHQTIEDLSIAYGNERDAHASQVTKKALYQDIKENDEIYEQVKKLTIKDIYKVSTKEGNVAGLLKKNGRILDDYEVYHVYRQDEKADCYSLFTIERTKGKKTFFFFNIYNRGESYILFVKK